MDIIEAVHINKTFGSLQVLKGISVTIRKGEIVTICLLYTSDAADE